MSEEPYKFKRGDIVWFGRDVSGNPPGEIAFVAGWVNDFQVAVILLEDLKTKEITVEHHEELDLIISREELDYLLSKKIELQPTSPS